jgi:NDP-sugar pyrophosphorylase family protein
MQCVILAGGMGTRMTALFPNIHKCLIPINGIPFIDYQLKYLSNNGITKIVLSVGHLAEQVRDYVQDGSKWDLHIEYIEDGKVLLGTGGAVRKAFDAGMLDEEFLIIYGDSFLPINIDWVCWHFSEQSLPALMTIYHNENKLDISNAIYENGFVLKNSKPKSDFTHIDYGLTILNRNIIKDYIPTDQKYDLSTLFHQLSIDKKLAGYIINERFYEIGSPAGLQDFTDWIDDAKATYNT